MNPVVERHFKRFHCEEEQNRESGAEGAVGLGRVHFNCCCHLFSETRKHEHVPMLMKPSRARE